VVDRFPEYHAAHFQLGQLLADDGDTDRATRILQEGIAAAQKAGDRHAAMEMTESLNSITG
jgi:lipopolysaccharide biosynthesis regulator YciM